MLERDADAKKIVMTLKKALIGSKLPALAHLEVPTPPSRPPLNMHFLAHLSGGRPQVHVYKLYITWRHWVYILSMCPASVPMAVCRRRMPFPVAAAMGT